MTIKDIILRGSQALNITPEAITGPSRKDAIVTTRHAISDIAYNYGYKYREIAVELNRKSHATIINACRRSCEMKKNNNQFRLLYNLIKNG